MIKKVLLTGANGLLGKRVTRDLILQDFEVFNLTRTPCTRKHVQNLVVDLSSDWESSKLPAQIDAVIHLAQSNKYKQFPSHASDIFEVNVSSSSRLLEYARNSNAKVFIFTSTGGVYGTSDKPFHESQASQSTLPDNFYVSTKWCTETLIQNYSDFFNTVIFRPFFIYGRGQNRSMFLPRIYDSIKRNDPVKLQGNNGIKINPIHVSDASNAIISSLNSQNMHYTYNLAGKNTISLRQICELFGNFLNTSPKYEFLEKNLKQDIIGDITLLSQNLMSPELDIKDVIEEFSQT